MDTAIELKGITKHYPNVVANDNVNLSIIRGTIHALVGENGSGKSTLMKVLYGIIEPNEGSIIVDGIEMTAWGPAKARRYGIGMIQQSVNLVDSLSIYENLILGTYTCLQPIINTSQYERIISICKHLALDYDLSYKVNRLSVAMKQKVAILKLLSADSNILILDEPTRTLKHEEIEQLFDLLRILRLASKSIIIITHNIYDALQIADTITVMRQGRIVSTRPTCSLRSDEILIDMFGIDQVKLSKPLSNSKLATDVKNPPLLSINNVFLDNKHGVHVLNGLNLDLTKGHITGLLARDRLGAEQILDLITGVNKPLNGKLIFNGEDLAHISIKERRQRFRIACIHPNREQVALIPLHSVLENVILKDVGKSPFSSYGFLILHKIKKIAKWLIGKWEIECADINQPIHTLSGGNQQKVVMARESYIYPNLLILYNPCQGLDSRSQSKFFDFLANLVRSGSSILYLSDEIDELFECSDYLAILESGIISMKLNLHELSRQEVEQRIGYSA